MVNAYCNNFWQEEEKQINSVLSYKHKCIISVRDIRSSFCSCCLQMLNTALFTCIIFVFL